jgi:hypothetical protein
VSCGEVNWGRRMIEVRSMNLGDSATGQAPELARKPGPKLRPPELGLLTSQEGSP